MAGLVFIKTTFVKIRILPVFAAKKILIAPLDWGAGHTTRCMPLVGHLLQNGHMPIFAGTSAQCAMVDEVFGNEVTKLHLDGYNITYSSLNKIAQAGLLLQMPRVLKSIRNEQQWLRQTVKEYGIGGVISDNRYGLYHAHVPSVIMTHQLHVLSGMGNAVDGMVQRMHYRRLARFGNIWVVDTAGEHSLAGDLSHPYSIPANAQYIGLLSRFANETYLQNVDADSLLILLSGPEPQRGVLSKLLWEQAIAYGGKVIFAEGSDSAAKPAHIPPHIIWHHRLAGAALEGALQQARLVVCRSGYSTLMDLAAIGKRAILIPTPGQTEQEYLGRRMHERAIHYTAQQASFDMPSAIKAAGQLSGNNAMPQAAFNSFGSVVDEWLAAL